MSARRAVVAVCLLFARPLVADGGRAAEVASWLAGTFELKDPGSGGAPEAVRIVIVAVPKSRIANGALVLYREEAAAPKLDEPSQQRFYRLEEDGDVVRLRAFDPKDPILVRGKWREPSALALYGANDVRERPGCTMLLRKKGDLWEGETPGKDCPSTVKTAATMTSVLILAQDGFTLWERGFDENGRQTWTSPEGGTRFLKRSMNAPVDDKLIERPVGRRGADSKRPYSGSTTSVPVISSWPSPQKTSQWNGNVPSLSGVSVTRVTSFGTMSFRILNARQVEAVNPIQRRELEYDGFSFLDVHLGGREREPLRGDLHDPGLGAAPGRHGEKNGQTERVARQSLRNRTLSLLSRRRRHRPP